MRLSVTICTRQRAESLRRTLDSIASCVNLQTVPWEIVVVDNGSRDHTLSVIESYTARLPIRAISEPVPGLSRARNRGLAAARGDYIVWTDDDVEVGPNWLGTYLAAFDRFPNASLFGGKILPVLEPPVPAWLGQNQTFLAKFLAARDFGPNSVALAIAGDVIPFGANFAVRTTDQRRFPYDESIGAGSGQVGVGEETTMIKAMLGAGLTGVWVPGADVSHHFAHSRMTLAHVKRWYEGVGFVMERDGVSSGPTIGGVPRWIFREVTRRLLRYQLFRILRPSRIWLPELAGYSVARGRMAFWMQPRLPPLRAGALHSSFGANPPRPARNL